MVVSTSSSATILKRSLGKNQTSISSIDKIIDQFILDPALQEPVKDVFVITNEDISAARVKTKFEQALATKHPAVKIIFINKSSRPIYQNGCAGIDVILQKPKPNQVTEAIESLLETATISEIVTNKVIERVEIPDYVPEEPHTDYMTEEKQNEDEELNKEVSAILESAVVEEPQEVEVHEELVKSDIVTKIEETRKVAEVTQIVREITASNVIKDLINTNSTYAGIEDRLRSLNDIIFSIMHDTKISSLDEKLSKVRALLHDKAFYNEQGDTLIEQRLEEIIDTICSHVSSLLESRLDEINQAIRHTQELQETETMSARLAGLSEERTNLMIELRLLEGDINEMFKRVDSLIMETATMIAATSETPSDNDNINMHLQARGANIVSDGTLMAIMHVMDLSKDKVPTEFKEMKLKITNMIRLLNKLFDMDKEIIAAQQALINFYKSKNIEDTVVAETRLKMALRIYVGEETTGRTIIPYLLSKRMSRQNANVLVMDLTGRAKYDSYKIRYESVDDYCNTMTQSEFTLAVGSIDNTVEAAQRIVTTLIKSADYYRVINVVLDPEQIHLFETIAQDALSINYIVDTNNARIERMNNFISATDYDNVGQRVIINKCDVPVSPIITKLGLDDKIDFQMCTIKNVPAITNACLLGYNPYGISAVDMAMEVVLKHVKS